MRVQPVPFTTSGVAASALPGTNEQVCGVAFRGFTSVTVHDGSDATGPVVLHCPSPGTYAVSYELYCEAGTYVECVGSGNGTVWLA